MNCNYVTDATHTCLKREVFAGADMAGATEITLGNEKCNNYLGIGCAITGSSCYNLARMDSNKRTELLKKIYSPEGLNLSVGRLSIGASDYSAELYSYDDYPFDTSLEHFSVERDEKYIIPIIKEIIKIRPDIKLFASPWSPPAWMKTGNNLCGGFMRREYVGVYAKYIVKFLKAYKEQGIDIFALTPQNECETSQRGRMPACIWHPEIEAEFVSALRKELTSNGLDTEIWLLDYNFILADRVLWQLEEFPKLKDECNGVAFHYYNGYIEQTTKIKEKYPNLNLHFSEAGPRLYDNYATDWCKWGIMLSKSLNCGYSSFTGWNLMLDEESGPNVGPFRCGGLVTLNSVTDELSYSGQYKAFEAIGRYIKPASVIYGLNIDNKEIAMSKYPAKPPTVYGIAIKNKTEIVFFLINDFTDKVQTKINLDGKCYYVELLKDSINTVVIDNNEA